MLAPHDPPRLDCKSHGRSLIALYEDIIAANSETIRLQQQTFEMQRDVIRQLRDMLEVQEGTIKELISAD